MKEKLFLMWVVRWCDVVMKFWVRETFGGIPGVLDREEGRPSEYEEFSVYFRVLWEQNEKLGY